MPLPTQNDVRPIDPVMTNLSVGFKNEAYFWDKLAPTVEVSQKSGTFFKWTKDYWLRREEGSSRAPGGPYTRVQHGVTTDTYDTQEEGFEEVVDDSIRKASQTPEGLDVQAVRHLTTQMELFLEKAVATELWKTGVWGTDKTLAGNNQWSNSDSNPITEIDSAIRIVKRNTGSKPDVLYVSGVVWDYLKEHTKIIEKYKYSQKAILTEELVAAALGLKKIYVMDSVENTAKEGLTYSGSDIWGKHALLTKETRQPALNAPSGAYTFMWSDDGNTPWAMENYRDEPIRSDVHRIRTHLDIKVCASDWGYFFNNAVA